MGDERKETRTDMRVEEEEVSRPEDHSVRDSFLIALSYLVLGGIWHVAWDVALRELGLPDDEMALYGLASGAVFVVLSAAIGYAIGLRYLGRLYRSQQGYADAQSELRRRDQGIRQAYIDVLDAVTGGKLVIVAPEEVHALLGDQVMPMTRLSAPGDLASARDRLGDAMPPYARANDVKLAASEALTNVLKHADGGSYGVSRADDRLQVVVSDSGPGIDFRTLPKATLLPGFSTKQSLGMGFTIMLNLTDRVVLATQPGETVLILEFDLRNEKPQQHLQ